MCPSVSPVEISSGAFPASRLCRLFASSAAQTGVQDHLADRPPDSLYLFPVLILGFLDLTSSSFLFHYIV